MPSVRIGRGFPVPLTGATSATRYVGGNASGAPVSGTFAVGDFVVNQDGSIFVCTVAGSPGTWVDTATIGPSVSSVFSRTGSVAATDGDYYGVVAAAKTGATAASRYVGATASGAPASGTFVVGDHVIDQAGSLWVCTGAGTPGTWTQVTAAALSSGALTNAMVNASAAIDSTKLSFPAFASYAATWTSTGTQPALGNGTLVSRYVQIGKSVRAWIVLTMGSTTTFGTGNYIFSLPATVHASTPTNFAYGVGSATRSSVYPVVPMSGSGAIVLGIPAQPISQFVGPTVPATFVSGDIISFNVMYEAA